jgi:hypothetical protein
MECRRCGSVEVPRGFEHIGHQQRDVTASADPLLKCTSTRRAEGLGRRRKEASSLDS